MLNFIRPPQFKLKSDPRENFFLYFRNAPDHQWIYNNFRFKKLIEDTLSLLLESEYEYFTKHQFYLIPCEAHYSCAIGKTQNHHLILIFPELKSLLLSAHSTMAMAILLHEMGHIFYQHTEKRINPLKAQIEADDFAFKHGLGEDLIAFLKDYHHNSDCEWRVKILTEKMDRAKKGPSR